MEISDTASYISDLSFCQPDCKDRLLQWSPWQMREEGPSLSLKKNVRTQIFNVEKSFAKTPLKLNKKRSSVKINSCLNIDYKQNIIEELRKELTSEPLIEKLYLQVALQDEKSHKPQDFFIKKLAPREPNKKFKSTASSSLNASTHPSNLHPFKQISLSYDKIHRFEPLLPKASKIITPTNEPLKPRWRYSLNHNRRTAHDINKLKPTYTSLMPDLYASMLTRYQDKLPENSGGLDTVDVKCLAKNRKSRHNKQLREQRYNFFLAAKRI
jgi:hypothetical protein